MTQWPYQDARRGPLSSENHQQFRDAGGLPSLVVSRYSVAEALTERFPRPLVSIAGSEVSWVDEWVCVYHDPKGSEFPHLTHAMAIGIGGVAKV
jgi:hypothetical protein